MHTNTHTHKLLLSIRKPRSNLPEIVETVDYGHYLVGHYSAADYLAHDGFELEFHCCYLSQPVSLFHTNRCRCAKFFKIQR